MGFGFEAVKDRWLSQQRWDDYVSRVREAAPRGTASGRGAASDDGRSA